MKSPTKLNDRPVILSLHDCWDALKKGKKIILFSMLAMGTLLCYNRLTRPLFFTAEGTFKSNTAGPTGLTKALEGFLDTRSERFMQSEDPKLIFLTQPVLQEAVLHLNLQGHLSIPQKNGFFLRIWRNLKTESAFARYGKTKRPASTILNPGILVSDQFLFPDPPSFLKLANVTYSRELYTPCNIRFEDEEHFFLTDVKGTPIAQGVVGEPLSWEYGSFTLIKSPDYLLKGRTFHLTWIPLAQAAESLSKSVSVKRHKTNPSLLVVSYTHGNRLFAADIVNAVMLAYQKYITKEGERKISKQLNYLVSRQEEMERRLDATLLQHQKSIEACLGNGHFLSLQEEGRFMASSQAECQSHLMELRMTMQRLKEPLTLPIETLMIQERLKSSSLPEEYLTLHLKDALELLSKAQVDLEKTLLNRQKYEEILAKLDDDSADLTAFSTLFEENSLKSLFEAVQTLHLKLVDETNWTQKEKERIKRELETSKQFLHFHLFSLKESSHVLEKTLYSKIESLKVVAFHLLVKEYDLFCEKFHQIELKSLEFVNDWLTEKKIDLSTTLHASIIESIAKMIEAKNVAYHTECIDAYPFVQAQPPIFPNPPRLRFGLALGGIIGSILSIFFILLRQISKGASCSYNNLKTFGLHTIGKLSSPFLPPLSLMTQDDIQTIRILAHTLVQYSSSSRVILCLSQAEMSFLDELIALLAVRKDKILWISMDSILEPGLFSCLTDETQPQAHSCEGYDFISAGHSSISKEILLHGSKFQQFIETWKESYQWIFIQSQCTLNDLSSKALFSKADTIIFQATIETLADVAWLPSHTLFLSASSSQDSFQHQIALNEVSPLLERLKKNFYRSSFTTKDSTQSG